MSSPESTTSVPPPAKKRRMWSLGGETVLSCVRASSASSASPQHTKFCGLLTAIPQVQVRRTRPQKLCGSMPRAQENKNIISLNQEIIRSLGHTDPGRFSLCPLDGASAPSMESVYLNPLALHQEAWGECSPHPWVLATVIRGYRLQFAVKPPPFNGVIASVANGDSARVLEAEISSLLEKRAIRRVPVGETQRGYYSRYFLIPKKDGGLHLILDLHALNKHLRKYKFKMLTVGALTRSIRRGDWFATVDLKDAYFHISVYPAHRKYLRFSFQNEVYEFVTLPFGLSLAPRAFSRCIEAALSPLRRKGLRISAYLDDYPICAHSRECTERDIVMLTSHLMNLGFRINYAKSHLIPSQEIEYLGLRIDSVEYRAMLSERRIMAFYQCLARFRVGNMVSFRTCLCLLGMMASSLSVVPLGLLKMRSFQHWVCGEASVPTSAPRTQSENYHGVRDGSSSAEKPLCIPDRSLAGQRVSEKSSDNGRIPNGMGSCFSGQIDKRSLDASVLQTSHKHAGVNGSLSSSETFSPVLGGFSCSSQDRQHDGGGIYQSLRGNAFVATAHPSLAREAVAGRDCPAPLGRALATPIASGPAVPSRGANFSPPSGTNQSLGLAREGLNLNALGLPQEVINTIRSARAPSTRSLYDLKWQVFEDWCTHKGVIPFQCAVSEVLCFLQSLLNNGRAFSTIKVYLAAISACHVGFEGVSVGRHSLIGRFMKGVRRLRPVSKRLVPSWDLSMVLNALTQAPFEPLESVHIKLLSLKTVLLLALASAKRVGELHALSVHQACLNFSPDDSKVMLLPNPAFVPKVSDSAYNCSALELRAFYPPPFSSSEERKLHTLCPVRALRFYVNRTRSFRKNDQLFVSWATHCKGKPISSQRLSHWMVEAIELA
ncbi:Gag-Pol polyprotein [Labeo rohita]|uniref:ribonuclease H n=1 Tax=Labeo rohita TaxID=84645 RepID=A0ABQ8MGY0_LABRO|nr:Gag-Pol polyprotein [Labeo rohita]